MKKTVNVNIGGAPFTVDEDAYGMLKKYLNEIEIRLDGVDDKETMQDIETRIADIFSDAISPRVQVVDTALVKRAIAVIGPAAAPASSGNRAAVSRTKNPDRDPIGSAGFTGAAARRSSAAYAAVSPSTRKSILRWSGSLWRCSSFSESA